MERFWFNDAHCTRFYGRNDGMVGTMPLRHSASQQFHLGLLFVTAFVVTLRSGSSIWGGQITLLQYVVPTVRTGGKNTTDLKRSNRREWTRLSGYITTTCMAQAILPHLALVPSKVLHRCHHGSVTLSISLNVLCCH